MNAQDCHLVGIEKLFIAQPEIGLGRHDPRNQRQAADVAMVVLLLRRGSTIAVSHSLMKGFLMEHLLPGADCVDHACPARSPAGR